MSFFAESTQLEPASCSPAPAMPLWEDPKRLWQAFKRRRRLVGATFGLCLFCAVVYIVVCPRAHRATALLLLVQPGERPLTVVHTDGGQRVEDAPDFVRTQAAVIASAAIMQPAIDAVGLEKWPALAEKKAAGKDPCEIALDGWRISQPDRMAKVVRLDYTAPTAEEATRLLDAVITSYRNFLREEYQRNSEVLTLLTRAYTDACDQLT